MKKPSARTKSLIAKGRKYYTAAYKPREMILDRGKGALAWDLDGNDYVDLGAGIAVSALGHHRREMLDALMGQAKKLWHTSNIYFTAPPVLLAEELVKSSKFARRVFLTNSGGEANEAAIKLARKYAADKGRPAQQRNIVTFTGSFHGRTLATVTATAQPKYQAGFEPLPPGFRYCPFNDFAAASRMIDSTVCAVLIEPVQGEGGITPAKPGFLKHLQELCHKHDALLMLDEVQCGMGRCGALFAYFAERGVKPDVVTLAKALGGGIPIGAMLVGEKAENVFQYGSHGSTFGGNPLACAVARVVLQKLQTKTLQKNIRERGTQLASALAAINNRHGVFSEIRGRGLMIGAELSDPHKGKASDIVETARSHGVLVLQAGPNVLRFLPPLTITEKEMKEGVKRLEQAIQTHIGPPSLRA
ncbi:MAG: aspartate aminotransferase family protein [Pseudomonadota bacterium]|nr:aspartate aminotransferase family protein [Pseudomonadota bacterium]MDE3037769.1 aspartate aminotransferase family protein [Pseudomonadota bacterium]